MKPLKFIVRFSLFVLVVLFAVASSTHAQQCPGYNPTMTQGAPYNDSGMIPSDACSGRSGGTWSFYETSSLTDYCGSYATGGYLSYYSTVTGNGVAVCGAVDVYCGPTFYAYLTVAQNQQDYNRFYNQAYDGNYNSSTARCVQAIGYSR